MTSSSSPPTECGLDTMILVFSLLQGHPANLPCEQLLRSEPAWFTSPLVIMEAKNILTKAYGVDAGTATGNCSTSPPASLCFSTSTSPP